MEPNTNEPQINSDINATEPVQAQDTIATPQQPKNNSKWIVVSIITILILGGGYFAYTKFFNKSTNQTNTMDTQNTESPYVSNLTGDEKLISESIQQLHDIVIKQDAQSFIDYTTKPMVLMGLDKRDDIKETLNSTKETMNNENSKKEFFKLFLPIVSGLTPEVFEPQLINCKIRDKNENFPPSVEKDAICTFSYMVDPSLVGSSKDSNPIPE